MKIFNKQHIPEFATREKNSRGEINVAQRRTLTKTVLHSSSAHVLDSRWILNNLAAVMDS